MPAARRPGIEELEARILYSADAALLLGAGPVADVRSVDTARPAPESVQSTRWLVVDRRVEDWDLHLADLQASATATDPALAVLLLDADADGQARLAALVGQGAETEVLAWRDAHGTRWLGATPLETATVSSVAPAAAVSPDLWEAEPRHALVVIDGGIEGAAQLAMMWWSQASAASPVEVVVTDPAADGVSQLTALLSDRRDLSAVHLVSHGEAGQLRLGTTTLDAALLAQRAQEVAGWRAALTDEADLLVYGCDVGQGLTGAAFVQQLSDLTGADVAASTDLTGGADVGGDWQLELQTGSIERAARFDAPTEALWQGTLATYTVTNLNDAGAGSLRQAITNANANGGADAITFSTFGTINLTSALPVISGAVTINGTNGGAPGIVLNGGGTVSNGLDLRAGSSGSTVRGLVLQAFSNAGISVSDSSGTTIAGNYLGTDAGGNTAIGNAIGVNVVNATSITIGGPAVADRNIISGNTNIGVNVVSAPLSGIVIQGNYIGTNVLGSADLGNLWHGIFVNLSSGLTIEGNVVSGNGAGAGAVGITLGSAATDNVVTGNIVGLNAAGSGPLANAGVGIQVLGSDNTVGGTTVAERNVVSGNATLGIRLSGVSASRNTVLGNWVGLSGTGLTSIGNNEDGIQIDGGASDNTLGGLVTGAGNVVSGNFNAGIAIDDALSVGNGVLGNTIGLAANGSTVQANAHNGINVNQAVGTVIGSTQVGGRNVISGNSQSGIALTDAAGARVMGNYIGTDATGQLSRGNGWDGVRLGGTTDGAVIGGPETGAGNLIAYNVGDGVLVEVASGRRNAVFGNAITANGETGIDLGLDNGTTLNDLGDGDAGANNLQNFPVLTSAVSSRSGTTLVGSLNSTASQTFRIDFYANHKGGEDATGYGEGERHLGFTTVTTSVAGNVSFSATLGNAWVNHQDRVSATATVDLGGGNYGATSEFSMNVIATASSVVVVDTTADTADGTTTSIANLGNNRGADGYISLREALLAVGNDSVGGSLPDKIVFAIRGTDAHTITLASALPTIGKAVDIDASTDDSYAAQGNVPAIVLDGANAVQDGLRLYSGSGGSSVRGLNIQRFTQDGLDISSSGGHTIAGNWFGLATDGLTSRGNQQGVNLWNSNDNLIGGASAADRNVLSANTGLGVWIGGTSTGNQITGNYVGTSAAGTAAVGNLNHGIWIESAGNTVGGTSAGQRNVISGNGLSGVILTSAAATGNVVVGNYIGTDWTGTLDLDGGVSTLGKTGVVVQSGASNNRIGTNADGTNDAAERNVIAGNNWYGVELIGTGTSGNFVQGNYIGTNLTGLVALGNATGGVSFWNGASANQVGSGLAGAGNVISGNGTGVLMANGVANNRVQGNLIGLGADGSTVVGNSGAGVYFYNGETTAAVTGNLIGTNADGTDDTGERNVISANYNGVVLEDAEITGNTVAGNFIGTDATGLLDRGNTFDGVRLAAGAGGNTVGGTLAAQRNLISGNGDNAVEIADEATDGNTVRGNWLGVNAAGTGVLGNGGSGVFINSGADNSLIGGTGANSGNWIAGAGLVGIEIDGASSGTLVQGNRIGTDLAGTANWGTQQNGILLEGGATGNRIGGTAAGAGNTVAFSGAGGVWTSGIAISGNSTTGNAVLGNTVYGGVGLGIDLGTQGVTANDADDVDTGANNLQNAPVLTVARTNGTSLTVNGTLDTEANSYYRIELFATTTPSSSGHGDGRRYLGSTHVATGSSGTVSFGMGIGTSVAAGEFLTATATKSNASYTTFTDTSEFARNIVAVSSAQATVTVDTVADTSDGDTTSLSTLLANKGADGFISLREAITAANNTANGTGGVDRIHFDITDPLVGGAHTITLNAGALPQITDGVVIDGSTEPDFSGTPRIVLDGANTAGVGLAVSASDTTLRGLVVSRFTDKGIEVSAGAANVTIAGNYIGTDATGLLARGNAGWGIDLVSAGSGIVIGGSTVADRNVIAGNQGWGAVAVNGTSGVVVSGNYIGVGADGLTALGNSDGIFLFNTLSNVRIGGTTAAHSNVIAHGTGAAIQVGNGASGVSILGNRLFDNAGMGIDLETFGSVQANDNLDADTGANALQNYPVLASAVSTGGDTTVSGTLHSTANTTLRIEFFSSPTGDASGHGEGQTFLGFTTVTTDASGNASVSTVLSGVSLAAGVAVTATATVDLGGGTYGATSEFSANATVSTVTPGFTVQHTSHTAEGQATGRFSVVLNTAPTADVTIALSVSDATELSLGTSTLTFTAANWNVAQQVTVSGVDDSLADGTVWSTVYLAAAVSADPAYHGLNPTDVSMQNADSDTFNTLVVDTAADTADGNTASIEALYADKGADGFVSLREAITAANNTTNGTGGADWIHFGIAGTGTHTINVASALPVVTDRVVLDASTDDSFAAAGSVPAVQLLRVGGSSFNGLELASSAGGSTVRGLVISNMGWAGIALLDSAGNTIVGNYLGTSAAGTGAAGNQSGVLVAGAGSWGNVIGGTTTADRNVISGNLVDGVQLLSTAHDNQVLGNYIGTNAAGTAALPNSDGVVLRSGTTGNTLGGTAAGAGNLVSGNLGVGVRIVDAGTSGNVVVGNAIGVGADGVTALPNLSHGMALQGGASSNRIGGTAAGEGNLIAYSTLVGILVEGATSTDNAVLGNVVLQSGGLAIDLAGDGVTGNDAVDADIGANGLQNTPVLASAVSAGADTVVTGTLHSNASTSYRIEFFSSPTGDASGHGEAAVYLGATTVTTDASGNAGFGTTLTGVSVQVGHVVSATATVDLGGGSHGSTSEFSANILAAQPNDTPSDLLLVPGLARSGLIGAYTFSSTGNLGLDNSGQGATMTLSGAPGTTAGPGGSAALDLAGGGSNQYGQIDGITTGGAMGIAATVRFDSTGSWERVIDFGQIDSTGITAIYIGRLGVSNDLTFTLEKNLGGGNIEVHRVTAAGAITNGQWMHLAATVDDTGVMALYIDGALQAMAAGVLPEVGVRTNHYVGKSNWSGDSPFDGAIDNLVLTRGALSAAQVSALWAQSNGFTLAEGAADGTVVATVVAADEDTVTSLVYSLRDDAGGRFAIATDGTITVADGSRLDHESASSHTITVRATDSGGLWREEMLTINLTNVNDAPAFVGRDGIVTTVTGTGDDWGNGVITQADGKILVAGYGRNGSNNDFALLRYNSDGTLDASFSGDGMLFTSIGTGDDVGNGVAVQADGKIVVAGYARVGSADDFAVVRYHSDGTLDTSFSGDGMVTTAIGSGTDRGHSLTLQADGKILVAGFSHNGSNEDFALVRYNSDGTLDTSFSGDGVLTTAIGSGSDVGNSVTLQADGKILVTGSSHNGGNNDFALVRYHSDGTLDSSFSGDGVLTTAIATGVGTDDGHGVTVQADGKILVAGTTLGNGSFDFALVRYHSDGTLDTGFSGDGIHTINIAGNHDHASSVTVQADGKILVAGSATIVLGNTDVTVVRYHSDGSLDTSFAGDGIVTTQVGPSHEGISGITVQADGKILVAGGRFNGSNYDVALVRYNSDGTLDNRFDLANTLGGTVAFTEDGASVALDANVQVFDDELSIADNFNGATLTLARNGGANAQDVFSATGTLSSIAAASGNLVVDGTSIGTYTNSAGTLVFGFNASATSALVNAAMQQIAYANSGDAPPASVQIDWRFDDGNTGAQGSGGALQAMGSTTVAISTVNDAPVNGLPANAYTALDTPKTFSTAGGNALQISDVDAASGTVQFSLTASQGTVSLASTVGLTLTGGSDGSATFTCTGTVSAINTALSAGVTFTPTGGFRGLATLVLQTSDLGNTGSGGTLTDSDTLNLHVGAIVVTTTSDAANGSTTSIADLIANDGGDGVSLREAILAANNTANGTGGADRIDFDIAGPLIGGAHTITLNAGALPQITDAVAIDGTTEPDFSGTPRIVLDGVNTVMVGLTVSASDTVLRGLVISDFDKSGIEVNSGAANVTIEGNYIGTDVTGLLSRGNGYWGIDLLSAGSGIVIGGTTAADRNVIAGNQGWGALAVNGTSGVVVSGNYIGVGADGVTPLTNNGGILVLGPASNVRIGGTTAAEGNVIAHGTNSAVTVLGGSTAVSVLGNRIFSHAEIGIDLGMDSVTANDTLDADTGANGSQNFPVLASAVNTGSDTTITGTLDSEAGKTYRIEFFSSPTGDASGHGEAAVYLGATTVTTDGVGSASFSATLTGVAVTAGHVVSATATVDLGGGSYASTSEFAQNVTATSGFTIAGTVWEDVDGDGDIADDGVGLSSAIVSFYLDDGDNAPDAGDSIVAAMLVNASGQYSLDGMAAGTYWVVSDSRSFVSSAGLHGGYTVHDQWAEQTYGAAGSVRWTDSAGYSFSGVAGSFYGGLRDDRGDNGASLPTAEHIVRVDLAAGSAAGVDFGFSYNVITNARDGDEVGANNRTVQGSLRQFLQNANALTGTQQSQFAIPGTGVHTIALATALPDITRTVVLDASTDDSFAVNGSRPAVVLDGGGASIAGLSLATGSGGSTVRGLAIVDFMGTALSIYAGSDGNTIAGNTIGLLADGNTASPNLHGIAVASAGNTIGGSTPADRNVVSGNINSGLALSGSNNLVIGNYFGTDSTGLLDRGNGHDGVDVYGGTGNRLGGTTAAERNVLSGNNRQGIEIFGAATGTLVQGNFIGTDATGTQPLGNGAGGIWIGMGTSNHVIGGTAAGAGNLIAFNDGSLYPGGVLVEGGVSGIALLGNLFHSNTGLAIDLGLDGVTANDISDADSGANDLQNTPVLLSVYRSGADTVVNGMLDSAASTAYRIEFFSVPTADASGHGEAAVYLGAVSVTTDGSGNASFSQTLTGVTVTPGHTVTATATVDLGLGAFGGTSEFAANVVAAAAAPAIVVQPIVNTSEGQSSGRFSVVLATAPTDDVTIGVSVDDASELSTSTATLTFTSANWNVAQTVTVTGVDDTVVDGNVWSTVRLAAAVSADLAYHGLDAADVSVQNADNDTFNTLVVTTASDQLDGDTSSIASLLASQGADGRISLREAITAANNTANAPGGADRIHFAIADALVGGIHRITLAHDGADLDVQADALPTVSEAVVIDATTEADWTAAGGAPVVVLDGTDLPSSADGLSISAGNSTVRGLVIQNFGHYGLYLHMGGGNTIEGNYIGTNATGTAAASNQWGIVVVDSANNVIGGTTAAVRNLLSGNVNDGINLSGAGSTGNQIQGNHIGTNLAGTAALGNGGVGIGIGAGASGNTVGGPGSAWRNLISGNAQYGIFLTDATTSANVVQSNWIGVDAAGTAALSNGGFGVVVDLRANTTTVSGNVISGNTASGWSAARGGVYLYADNVTVQGNLIGLDATGTALLGNGGGAGTSAGILVNDNSTGVLIGGAGLGEGNAIAGNTGAGVAVMTTGAQTTLLGNALRDNTGLAIDLGDDGLTANDAGDADTGANTRLNTPVLASAELQGSDLRVQGTLDTAPGTTLRIEFFSSSAVQADPSGHGEGATWLGHVDVTTDGAGHAVFDVTLLGVAPPAGHQVSATATLKTGASTYSATSEFSLNVSALSPNQAPVITLSGYSGSYTENAGVVFDPGATFADSDTPVLAGGTLTYQITANGTASDELGIRHQGDGAGQIGVSGGNVRYGGVLIGTHTGFGNGSTPMVVTFNGNATTAAVQALLRNITYRDTSDTPSTGTRTIELTVSDGSGGTSAPAVVSMSVVAVNDTPVFTSLNGSPVYTEGTAGIALDADVTLGDAELMASGHFSGAVLTLGRQGGAQAEDALAFDGLVVTTSGADVHVNGVLVGTYTFTGGELVVTFGAGATSARVDTLAQNIRYWNTSDTPPASVQIAWSLRDGNTGAQGTGGEQTVTGATTVTITSTNDAPAGQDRTVTLAEDGVHVFSGADFGLIDSEGHALQAVQITGLPGSGALEWAGVAVTVGQTIAVADLGQLLYRPAADANGTALAVFTFAVVDDGGVADGGVNTDPSPATFTVHVTAVNDAPVLTLPGLQATGIGTPLTLSTANGNPLTLADIDAAGAPLQLTLGTAHGTLTLASTAGLTFSIGDGTADASLVFSGSAAALQAALDGLVFTPAGGHVGAATLDILLDDLGNAGSGGTGTAAGSVQVIVGGLRFQEDAAGYTGTQDTYVQDSTPSTAHGTADRVLSDDSLPLRTGLIRFDNLFGSGAGQVPPGATISSVTLSLYVLDRDAADLIELRRMLSGWSESSTHTSLVNGVQTDGSEASATIERTFSAGQLGWNDIVVSTATVQAWLDGTAPNHGWALVSNGADAWSFASSEYADATLRPVLSIEFTAPQAPVVAVSGGSASHVEDAGVTVIDAGLTLTDADSATLTMAVVQLTTHHASGEDVLAFVDQNGITGTWNAAAGTLTLSGTASLAHYQTALRSVTYDNTSDSPSTQPRTVTFTVRDAYADSLAAARTVSVTATNDSPNITSDGGGSAVVRSVAENTTAVTTVTATDADLPVQMLSFSIVGGADAARFAIDANTGVLRFLAAPDVEAPSDAGADNVYDVVVQVSDGTQTDTQAVSVTVTAANDNAPAITSGSAFSVAENTTAVTTVTATDADLPVQTLSFSIVGGADAARFAIDANTGVLRFLAAPDVEAPSDAGADNVYDVLVQVSDGIQADTQAIAVTVTAVNDNAPTILSGRVFGVTENTAEVTTVAASDVDLPAPTLVFRIAGGVDATLFTVDSTTGALRFAVAPDHELPVDAGADNVYDVVVEVGDGERWVAQAMAVAVTGLNDNVPQFSLPGTPVESVLEGTPWTTTLVATDADRPLQALHYTLHGGMDMALFTLDPASGLLAFRLDADHEVPQDANGDNHYEVEIAVGDGMLSSSRLLVLQVLNRNESPVLVRSQVVVEQGARITLGPEMLQSTDVDTPATTLVYTVTDVRSGMFQRVQAPGVAVSQFTQAEVDAGQVVFEQAVDQVTASFVLSLSDGEGVVGPRQVVVQVKPTLLAASPALDVPPSAQAPGGGFADLASPQGGGLPLVDDVRSAVAASDGVPSTRTELTETGSDALTIPNRSAVSPRPVGSAASGGPGGGPRTASVTGSMVLAPDASRQSTSEMLVMLDVPIDLSGFAQERVALLQWNLEDASTHAAAEAARQQQDREEAPLLQWDSGTTVQVGSMALSVGLVFWATRATGLVASLLAVAPPWRAFDPLPVLSVHAPRQPEGPEVEWLDTDITGSLAELAEDILDQRP